MLNPGDAVQVNEREQTQADIKSGLYYVHYAGMQGKILKLYGEEASVLVTRESLPREVKARHIESEKAMKQRWLDGLSEEARGRLSAKDKEFALNYAILVAVNDLSPIPDAALSATESDATESAESVKRVSQSDLDAAEEAHLNKIAANKSIGA